MSYVHFIATDPAEDFGAEAAFQIAYLLMTPAAAPLAPDALYETLEALPRASRPAFLIALQRQFTRRRTK